MPDIESMLKNSEKELAIIFITSQAFIIQDDETPTDILNQYDEKGYIIYVVPALGEKCERCWKYRELQQDREHQTICSDCLKAL